MDTRHAAPEDASSEALEELPGRLNAVITPPGGMGIIGTLLLVNLLLLFTRPQNNLTFLAKIYIVAVMSLLPLPFWLPRIKENWTKQTKAMAAFLLYGAIRGPFVRNTFWAFHTWRDVTQSFVGFMFPLVVFHSFGSSLRRIGHICTFIGVYLGTYALTHKGCGPGGFLGDENDNCLGILMCVPFPLFLFQGSRSVFVKLLYILSGMVMLGGVVATSSRGGFVGVVAAAFYFFLKSRQKGAMLVVALICALSGAALVPPEYWKEMQTIENVNEGTALQRRIMWKRAFRIFLDPKYTVIGVGMENTRYHLPDYEDAEDFMELQRSFGGRQVHSMYLQLLADLGIIGTLIFGTAVMSAFFGNRNALKQIGAELRHLPVLAERIGQKLDKLEPSAFSPDGPSEAQRLYRRLKIVPEVVKGELRFIQAFVYAVNGSLLGVLVSSAFISVLYYPVVWFVITLSATAQVCSQKLFSVLQAERAAAEQGI